MKTFVETESACPSLREAAISASGAGSVQCGAFSTFMASASALVLSPCLSVLSVCVLGILFAVSPLAAQSPAPAPAVAPQPTPPADTRPETVISSDELDMVGGEEANHFYFRGNVRVQATNMLATCDELEVIAARHSGKGALPLPGVTGANASASEAPDSADAVPPSADKTALATDDSAAPAIGSIREIIMRGNVVISQEGRRATAGIAYLYPQEGRVVLAENPLVTDEQGTLSGWRMELYRGERKVRILSNPDEKQRTRVTLPALQDLGYGELGGTAPAAQGESATQGSAAANATTAPASAAQGQTQIGGSPQAGSTPATTSSAAQPQEQAAAAGAGSSAAADAPSAGGSDTPPATVTEEDAPRNQRSGGWNPVNTRRR